mgnify:CR=1 FL=1
MNKQELIEEIEKIRNNIERIEPREAIAFRRCLNIIEQLDEPNHKECELISNEYNICSCCSYNLNNLIKEIVVGCDTDDCECGRAVVHQIFWTDKYMNYCPNCGVKIKRKVKNENL